jgi:YD repeat-containing protein
VVAWQFATAQCWRCSRNKAATFEPEDNAMILRRTLIAAIALMALTGEGLAQARTFYDSAGRAVGRSTSNNSGATTYYDASGRVTGRSSTSGNTTTFYDAGGRNVGSVRTPPLTGPGR